MKKIEFKSGNIYKFDVPLGLGEAYCRIIDLTAIDEISSYLVKVYDTREIDVGNNIEELRTVDYLLNALPICRLPNLKGKNAWKLVGNFPQNDDSFLPDFKSNRDGVYIVEDESTIRKWYISRNYVGTEEECNYSRLSHLEFKVIQTKLDVETRVAMELIRLSGGRVDELL